VLAPYLAEQGVYVSAVSMNGDVKLDRIRSELKKIAGSFDYVTTFYDFYGFKDKEKLDTKDSLEKRIQASVHANIQPRFLPHVQMYEFESLLFSCPTAMQGELKRIGSKQSVEAWAIEILAKFEGQPEKINDSQQTAPSKRLEKNTNYRKTTHGPDIARKIGIEKIRQQCPGFHHWMVMLESIDK